MIAKGDVKFLIHDKNSTYRGNSDIFTYVAPKELFIFEGNVHITKIEDNQQLFGNKVIINKKTGESQVFGQKTKPVKFILKVND
jgi:lipopolysaccharide export system protein LptA